MRKSYVTQSNSYTHGRAISPKQCEKCISRLFATETIFNNVLYEQS